MKLDNFGFPIEYWLKSGDPRLKEASASREFAGLTSIGKFKLRMTHESHQDKRNKGLADKKWQEFINGT